MGLTSHKSVLLSPQAKAKKLRDARLVVIATEDTYAVKQYFESELFQSSRIKIEVLNTPNTNNSGEGKTKSSPEAVSNRLHAYVEKYDLDDNDILCIMIDKDCWKNKMLASVAQKTFRKKRKNILLAVSNPCFELWLYLHYAQWDSSIQTITSQKMEERLRQVLGGRYNKTNLLINDYRDRIEIACENARVLDTNPNDRWPQTIGTRVYQLIDELRNLGLFQKKDYL